MLGNSVRTPHKAKRQGQELHRGAEGEISQKLVHWQFLGFFAFCACIDAEASQHHTHVRNS